MLRDILFPRQQEVFFYKRAQLISKMLFDYTNGKGLGNFNDLNKLTLFADYKVPQVLNGLGILKYSDGLSECIHSNKYIPKDSDQEIEIRACAIQAGEIIKTELQKTIPWITSAHLDTYLWRTSKNPNLILPPHHLTRTIFY